MATNPNSKTSLTLLARLRNTPDDPVSWDEFVHRYGATIHAWCRRWGLQEADAHDVTQNVLLALAKQMREFEYDPSGRFRSWLKTIAYRAWCDFLGKRNRRERLVDDDDYLQHLTTSAANEDFLRRLEEECDREMLEIAMDRVRPRVRSHTWEAFRQMTFDQKPAAEVAEALHINEGSVFVARSRVQKMLMDEVDLIDRMEGGDRRPV